MDCFQRSFFVQARCALIFAQKNYAESNQWNGRYILNIQFPGSWEYRETIICVSSEH